jgi:hypothetical protein
MVSSTLLETARRTLPEHRVAVYEVKFFVFTGLRLYSKLGELVTAAIEQLEFEAGPDYNKEGINYSRKQFEAALRRRTSLLMLLDQYLEVFEPDWTDWPKVPKSWGARFSLYPLSLFKSLSIDDNKEKYNLSYLFGNGKSRKLNLFWGTFASLLHLPTKVVSKHLMSDLIMDYVRKIVTLNNDVGAMFEKVLNVVGATDNKRRGCIIASAKGVAIKSYYRWRGTKKTATVPMKIGMHRSIDYPENKSGWNDLIENFYHWVSNKKKLPQRPFDEEADERFWELREEYYSSKNKWYSHYLQDEEDSVVDVTDQMLREKEMEYLKKKDEAELIE